MERLTGEGEQLVQVFKNPVAQLLMYLRLKEYEDLFESLKIEPTDLKKIVQGYKIRGQIINGVRGIKND